MMVGRTASCLTLVAEPRATHICLAAWVGRLVKLTLIKLVTVLLLVSGQARTQDAGGETTGSISPPTSPIQRDSNSVSEVEPKEQSDKGMILVSKRPIEMLARPSSSAVVMYGFPPGRRFRLIGHESGFAQIKDLKSGATGWIDEAALAPAPGSPAVSSPSQPKPVAASRKSAEPSTAPKPKATKKDSQVTAGSEETAEPVQTPKRPGLFGGGGLFGGIFGNGNGNAN